MGFYIFQNMQNNEKNKKKEPTIDEAVKPLVQLGLTFKEQRMLLHEMFTTTVANAPDDEIENFTANRLKDFYLALCETLENLNLIGDIHADNIIFSMDRFSKRK